MASQATQVFASQGSQESSSQMSDWNDEEEVVEAMEEVEEVAEVKEEETEEEKKERQRNEKAHRTRLYQRLAFNLIWADPADTNQEIMMQQDNQGGEGGEGGEGGGGGGGGGGGSYKGQLQNGFGKGHRGDDSVIYGWNAINEFLQETNCTLIMRAHEATAGGVKICKHAKVITVFSTSKGRGLVLLWCNAFSIRCGSMMLFKH